jgi:hypothetical protein
MGKDFASTCLYRLYFLMDLGVWFNIIEIVSSDVFSTELSPYFHQDSPPNKTNVAKDRTIFDE